jgi:hypothetical protein
MVKQLHLNGIRIENQGACEHFVLLGGPDVTVGVVVGDNQRGSPATQGSFNHPARIHDRPVNGAFFERFHAIPHELARRIKVGDFKDFDAEATKPTSPKGFERIWRIQDRGLLGALLEVEIGSFANDAKCDRGDIANSLHLLEVGNWRVKNCAHTAEPLEQRFGGCLDIAARDAECEQDFNNLVLRKSCKAALEKPLTQTLPVSVIMNGVRCCFIGHNGKVV